MYVEFALKINRRLHRGQEAGLVPFHAAYRPGILDAPGELFGVAELVGKHVRLIHMEAVDHAVDVEGRHLVETLARSPRARLEDNRLARVDLADEFGGFGRQFPPAKQSFWVNAHVDRLVYKIVSVDDLPVLVAFGELLPDVEKFLLVAFLGEHATYATVAASTGRTVQVEQHLDTILLAGIDGLVGVVHRAVEPAVVAVEIPGPLFRRFHGLPVELPANVICAPGGQVANVLFVERRSMHRAAKAF